MKEAKIEKPLVTVILCFAIGVVWLCGESFRIDDNVWYLYHSPGQIFKSGVYLCGVVWLLYYIAKFVWMMLNAIIRAEFGTVLIGSLAKFGKSFVNTEFGFFLIAVLQSVIGILISAYMLYTMRYAGVSKWLENAVLWVLAL